MREAVKDLRRRRFRDATWGWLLFFGLLIVYNSNGDFLIGADATPNVYLSVSLLNEGDLSFTPEEMPFMFMWHVEGSRGRDLWFFGRWDERFRRGPTAAQLRREGRLRVAREKYYVVESSRSGYYVSTFGPGPGLTVLPLTAILHAFVGNLLDREGLLWYAAKFVASMLVSASAVMVFLTVVRLTQRRDWALLVSAAYGLATCVWSISSQTLWQHAPNEFFLALGVYLLVRGRERLVFAVFCGVALSAAVVCRPTSAIVLAAVGIFLLATDRRACVACLLASVPLLLLLGAYNTYYFEAPWVFGQSIRGAADARELGLPGFWSTPLWEGAASVLVSPSRGLLVYSPVVGFAFAGFVSVWRQRRHSVLRPLAVAVLVLLLISFKYYKWWGGHSYGYRMIVDTMPLFALLAVPCLDWLAARRWALAIFLLLLVWSMAVQALGAFAYNVRGWNAKTLHTVRLTGSDRPIVVSDVLEVERITGSGRGTVVKEEVLDIDLPQHRHRLWSLRDSQLLHYLCHLTASRQFKKRAIDRWLSSPLK